MTRCAACASCRVLCLAPQVVVTPTIGEHWCSQISLRFANTSRFHPGHGFGSTGTWHLTSSRNGTPALTSTSSLSCDTPNKNWYPWFRFYGPQKAIFDKSWRLPDIEKVN